jgi:glycerol kinase
MPELILAVDVGTTTARAAVVEPQGEILGLCAAALKTSVPAPGRAEQDPEGVWRTTLRVMRGALAAAGWEAHDLAGIGLATQRASAVVWDRADGRASSPLVLWSDLRGATRAGQLQAAGFHLSAQQPATKLEAILDACGGGSADLAWGALDSWLIWKLTGGAVHATDRSQAWPCGYLALADLDWNRALIEAQGLGDLAFPRLVDTWGTVGMTGRRVLGAEVPIAAVIADQQSALIAHGEATGTAKITWGTSAAFDIVTGAPVFAGLPGLPPLIVSSAAREARFCVEGTVLAAGSAADWLRRTIGLGSAAALAALADQSQDAGGVAFLPALQGLGAPHGEPGRLGRLAGLSSATTRTHVARAAFEGLAFRAREILERAQASVGLDPGAPLGIDGGMTRAPAFAQLLADLLSRPIRPLATPEATLMGAAMLVARGLGLAGAEAGMRAAVRPTRTVGPQLASDAAEAKFAAWRAAVHGP